MNSKRGVLIAGNWKMNLGVSETRRFFDTLAKTPSLTQPTNGLRLCLFPPYLSLSQALGCARGSDSLVSIGAQNAHWEKKGAFTGEVSGVMLQELGISWVLVGHSERRQYFGETSATVCKRTLSLLEQGFHVIVCIGETLKERQEGLTEKVLKEQVEQGVPQIHLRADLPGELILAYEPVWAIGTGQTASIEQAQAAHEWIRKVLSTHLNTSIAAQTQILYGGSVTPENISPLLKCNDIDGALVGGASLKAESFASLATQAQSLLTTPSA